MKGTILLDDDNVIKAILVQHGMSAQLEPQPGVALPFRYTVVWATPPFVYAVKRYVGYEDPLDNGYRAVLIPIAQNLPEEIEELIHSFADGGADLNRVSEAFDYRMVYNSELS